MTPTARTRRLALTFALLALVALLVVAVARSLPASSPSTSVTATARRHATPTTPTSALYLFDAQAQVPPDGVVRPGQTIYLLWQPQLDTNQRVTGSAPVHCTVALFGPFVSVDAALKAADVASVGAFRGTPSVESSALPLVLMGPSLTLDGVTGTPQSSALRLPGTLSPGYYVLDAHSSGLDGASGSDVVLSVQSVAA